MEFLDVLTTFFTVIAYATLAMVSLKYLFNYVRLANKRADVRRFDSKFSLMKIMLKSKLKRRMNQTDTNIYMNIDAQKEFRVVYERVCRLDFNSAKDYQTLLNELKETMHIIDLTTLGKLAKINHNLQIAEQHPDISKDDAKDSKNIDNSFSNPYFWEKLYRYEGQTLRLIYEIIELCNEFNTVADEYNSLLDKNAKKYKAPEPIKIESYDLLWQLMNESKPEFDDETQKSDPLAA